MTTSATKQCNQSRSNIMKMLFFSSERAELEEIHKEFRCAGIPSEIRDSSEAGAGRPSAEAELWIQNDKDCYRAMLLCVELGVGFARRAFRANLDVSEDKDVSNAR
jgi:hypothetical protein